MRPDLILDAEWTGAEQDVMAARLRLEIAGINAFRAENRWSRTIDEAPHLSAGPLARWLATNWWRLRWEGEPATGHRDTAWRMAHEIAAAGDGFLWPRLSFIADGETLRAECLPTRASSQEMLRFIGDFEVSTPAAAFEIGVDAFMTLVFERAQGIAAYGPLRDLWSEVLAERGDPDLRAERRLEAMLGYDPGEGDPNAMAILEQVHMIHGLDTAAELAALCNAPDRGENLRRAVESTTERSPVQGHLTRNLLAEIHASAAVHTALTDQVTPQGRGQTMATMARVVAGLPSAEPLLDTNLADLLGLAAQQIGKADAPGAKRNFGLAILDHAGHDSFLFKARHPASRRFEAARFLGDAILMPDDGWHLATAAGTVRQKIQRAFASEFLAPIAGLTAELQDDFSMEAIEDVAAHFRVSSYLVGSHLRNNGVIAYGHPAVPRTN